MAGDTFLYNVKLFNFLNIRPLQIFGNNLNNKNSIQEEIKSILKSGNTGYRSVQNLLSSSLLSKKLKIKIYRTVILPVVLYGCETWSLTLRDERRLRVFENGYVHTRALSSSSCAFTFPHCVRQGHAFWRMPCTHASTCPHLCVSRRSTCNKCRR